MDKNLSIKELCTLPNREFIVAIWEDAGKKVLEAIDRQDTKAMTCDDFLFHCTACGGNWGGMLLSGVKALYPEVYEAIPDKMGTMAWQGICTVIELLGVNMEFAEEEE